MMLPRWRNDISFLFPSNQAKLNNYIYWNFQTLFFSLIVGRGNLNVRFNKTRFRINRSLEAVNMLTLS